MKDMESAVSDICVDYEWYNIPPLTAEEEEKKMGAPVLVPKDGIRKFKLYLSRPPADSNQTIKQGLSADAYDPNLSPVNWGFVKEESATLVMKDGNSWQQTTKESCDGKVGRKLSMGGWPTPRKWAKISGQKQEPEVSLRLTPMGFSVFHTSLSKMTNYYTLSYILKNNPEMIYLDTTVQSVGGFKTIHIDLLQQTAKIPVARIYFSIDHNYTPVRFEYLRRDNPNVTFEVQTLEKIGENLWFPSSGDIINSDSDNINAFQTTSPIICNQKRDNKVFEIELPSGTEVTDEVKGTTYKVK
jgi:hypothetical protein